MSQSSQPLTVLVIFVGVFFAVTGGYAIVTSLLRLNQQNQPPGDHSQLETSLFKWRAPAGLIYGVVALLVVVGLIRWWPDSSARDAWQQTTNSGPYRATLKETRSQSLIGGKLLVTYEKRLAGGGSVLHFRGISGLSPDGSGRFVGTSQIVSQGTQFYLLLAEGSVWCVNVLEENVDLTIELFRFR